jgi:HD-like signal output (HDOD) protein
MEEAENIITKLQTALKKEGDFPASAKIVQEIQQIVNDPNGSSRELANLILKEPSLTTRLLHLVNSSYYKRTGTITTISGAILQLGLKQISELCSGLVLLQKFIPLARRNTEFTDALKRFICTALLSSVLSTVSAKENSKQIEEGYLAGCFSALGTLLLAYYFPEIYSAAIKRVNTQKETLSAAIFSITGLSTETLSIEVLKALELPENYVTLLNTENSEGAAIIHSANTVSNAIMDMVSEEEFLKLVSEVATKLELSEEIIKETIATLPSLFREHCLALDIPLPDLPEIFTSDTELPDYIKEIEASFEAMEPHTAIVTAVMEALIMKLNYKRVVLFDNTLQLKMQLGEKAISLPKPNSALNEALQSGKVIFEGKAPFDDSENFVILPIGFNQSCNALILADKAIAQDPPKNEIQALAEILDRSNRQK